MSSFLQASCGPYGLLFDVAHVLEVGDAPAGGVIRAGYCVWRERQMKVLDFSSLLVGRHSLRPQCLLLEAVDAESAKVWLVVVDSIAGIRDCDEKKRIQMPWLNERLNAFFAGGWLDVQTQQCLLQVRLPLQSVHFGEEESHAG